MPDPTRFDPDRVRVILDHGEVVELDGATLVMDGEESPSVITPSGESDDHGGDLSS
jgi:hypothetical protein